MPALSVTPARGKTLSQAIESDSARSIAVKGLVLLSSETDTALAVAIPPRRLVTSVTETDSSQSFTTLRGKHIADPAVELEIAQRVLPFHRGELNSLWGVIDGTELEEFIEAAFGFARASATVLVARPETKMVVQDDVLIFHEGAETIVLEEVKPNE